MADLPRFAPRVADGVIPKDPPGGMRGEVEPSAALMLCPMRCAVPSGTWMEYFKLYGLEFGAVYPLR